MDLRKIQRTGGSSYTVTLPKEWVANARLQAGDLVGFSTLPDGSLAVVPHGRGAPRAAQHVIEVGNDSAEGVFRRIVAAYLAGNDLILLRSKKPLTPAARRAVRLASRRIIGIEVVEEEPSSVALQDFLDPREFHIEKGLRRMQALARAMQEDALRVFTERPEVLKENFQERDDEVDRLHWMISKQYHALLRDPAQAQRTGLTAGQALNFLLVSRLIERTADHARRIAENLEAIRGGEKQARLESKMEKHARRSFQLFAEALAAFHRRDAEAANRIIEEAGAFTQAQEALLKESLSLGGEDIIHVAYALESVARTAAYAADIAETAINHHVSMRG